MAESDLGMNKQLRNPTADLARSLELELRPKRFWTLPRIAVAVVLIAAIVAAFFYPWRGTANPYVTAPVVTAPLVVTVSATGTLQPQDQVDVGAQISGRVDEVNVDYNDHVKKGEVLAIINTDQIRAQLAQAQAAQNAARADVANFDATVAQTLTKRDRARGLFKIGGMSQQDLQAAEADYQRALASEAKAKADVESTGAQAKLFQTQLDFALVRAPIDGIVLDRKISKGQTVAASFQTPVLFTLATDLSTMQLQVDIDEADIGSIRDGQGATFTVDAYPQRQFEAKLTSVRNAPKTTNGVVTYQGVLAVDNSSMLLRPGMTANVNITVAKSGDELLVPNGALRFTPPGKESSTVADAAVRGSDNTGRVWVLENGKPVSREVKLGRTDGRNTQVLSGGLKPGDRVITDVAGIAPAT
jgi:HlyD family secretion protein